MTARPRSERGDAACEHDARPTRWQTWGAIVLIVTVACGGADRVELVLVGPEDDALSPLDEELAEITLVRHEAGKAPERATYPIDELGELEQVGELEPGSDLRLGVELRGPGERVVGHGQSELVDISPSGVTRIPIVVRRPLIYVAGDESLAVFDASRTIEEPDYAWNLPVAAGPTAVAAGPDGTFVATVSGTDESGVLQVIGTSEHAVEAMVSLPMAATALVVSPDSRHVIAGHAGAQGGLSVIDLQTETPEARFIELGNVTRVAVSGLLEDGSGDDAPRLLALVDGARECVDGELSTLVSLALDDLDGSGATMEFPATIADVAALPDGSFVAAAPCEGQIQVVARAGSFVAEPLAEVERVSAVAVAGGRVWSVGSRAARRALMEDARLFLHSHAIDGAAEEQIDLPVTFVSLTAAILSDPGDVVGFQLSFDDVIATDLVVLPGEREVALLTRGTLAQQPALDIPLVGDLIPEITLSHRGYVLVRTGTGAPVHDVRTECDLEVGMGIIQGIDCDLLPGQDATDASYVPLGLSALYGSQ